MARTAAPGNRHAVLLLSGGVDSLVAALALMRAGWSIHLLHVSGVNIDAPAETVAARRIAEALQLPIEIIDAEWHGLREYGRAELPGIFDVYPTHNAIPFGRDMILIALGAEVAMRVGASAICLAHENDVWHREPVMLDGRPAWRTELASEHAAGLVNALLDDISGGTLRYFSPIAHLTKYAVVDRLMSWAPELLEFTSVCYWGRWCGECSKCMTYGILEAERGGSSLPFITNPLTALGQAPGAFDFRRLPTQGPGARRAPSPAEAPRYKGAVIGTSTREPLGQAAAVALATRYERCGLPDAPAFERFRREIYPAIRDRVDSLRASLRQPRSVAYLPRDLAI